MEHATSVHIRVSPEVFAELEHAAKARGTSVSAEARGWLNRVAMICREIRLAEGIQLEEKEERPVSPPAHVERPWEN